VLGDQQHAAAPLAADGEALGEAQQHEQRGRPVADLGERRQAPMRNVATPTRMIASCRSFLRPYLSPKWPKTMPPRGRDEADGIGHESGDDAGVRVVRRREHDEVEHERRGGGVQEELVPLDDGARHGCRDDASETRLLVRAVGCRAEAMRCYLLVERGTTPSSVPFGDAT
jgi:hypothetical protein